MVGIVNGSSHLLSINELWFVMDSWEQFVLCRRVSDCLSMNGTVHRHQGKMAASVLFYWWQALNFRVIWYYKRLPVVFNELKYILPKINLV